MRSPLKRAPYLMRAILTIVAVLSLAACAAFADAPHTQHTTWGRLKARYRSTTPRQEESFQHGGLNQAPKVANLASMSLTPSTVAGGGTSQGTVVLNSGAPIGGAVVTLSSDNAALASVPPTVTINAGSKTATFTVTTSLPAVNGNATLSASYNGNTRSATLAVTAQATPPPAAAALSSVTLAPASVLAGNTLVGTVSLSAAAPGGGALISLASGDPALVGVPASLSIAGGSTSATFTLTSTPSPVGGSVIVTATYLGASRSATLAVAPSNPCASVTGLGGDAVISSATVPQFRSGRLRIDLVADVPAGWLNALGPCATTTAPAVAFISGTGDVTQAGSGHSVTGAAGPLAFAALAVPPGESGVVLAADAAGNVLQIIWPALAGLPPGPPVLRMNLVSWSAAVQAGVALDAAMTFTVRSADGSVATFTAHGANMVVPAFRP